MPLPSSDISPCFTIRTPHIYIEEVIREEFFDMKYHH